MSGEKLIPLESNPEVLNKFLANVGVSEKFKLVDVLELDPDFLSTLPKTVAFILLFPCNENYEATREKQNEELKDAGIPENLFFMRQTLDNACGTIALFHAILNNTDVVELNDGPLKDFYEKAKGLNAEERGKLLENDEKIVGVHKSLAPEGQTDHNPEEKVNFHYAALTQVDGKLYELDGRKNFPIPHGETSDESFKNDMGTVCKKLMSGDPDELRFTVMAIVEQ